MVKYEKGKRRMIAAREGEKEDFYEKGSQIQVFLSRTTVRRTGLLFVI
jgi:hypothetical protein